MEDSFHIEIPIPPDNKGFILLKCAYCGELFKIKVEDLNDDGILNIYCPSCGLISEQYFTNEVLELAQIKIKNKAIEIVNEQLNNIEKQFKNSFIKFKRKKIKYEVEPVIYSSIEAMEEVNFPCCKRKVKIKPLLKVTGCYCPFCGVKEYGIK